MRWILPTARRAGRVSLGSDARAAARRRAVQGPGPHEAKKSAQDATSCAPAVSCVCASATRRATLRVRGVHPDSGALVAPRRSCAVWGPIQSTGCVWSVSRTAAAMQGRRCVRVWQIVRGALLGPLPLECSAVQIPRGMGWSLVSFSSALATPTQPMGVAPPAAQTRGQTPGLLLRRSACARTVTCGALGSVFHASPARCSMTESVCSVQPESTASGERTTNHAPLICTRIEALDYARRVG